MENDFSFVGLFLTDHLFFVVCCENNNKKLIFSCFIISMSDVANILGVAQAAPTTAADETARILGGKTSTAATASAAKGKGRKPKGMSRELFSLMGQDGIAPSVQSNKAPVVSGFKTKRVSAFQGKWLWAPFSNSARGYVVSFAARCAAI
jgi:hypothetical protein